MASDGPSWLQTEDPVTTSVTLDGIDQTPAAGSSTNFGASGTTNTSATISPQDEKDLPQIILWMRLANMGVAAAVITISIILMISVPPVSSFVLAIYAVCGGLLICCLETQLKFVRVLIAVNFGFLFHSVWRFLFYLILGSVCWSYDKLYGQIVAACCAGVALFNTYILCRYPAYRAVRERIAQEEDKRIEARISKQVKKQAMSQVFGGSSAK